MGKDDRDFYLNLEREEKLAEERWEKLTPEQKQEEIEKHEKDLETTDCHYRSCISLVLVAVFAGGLWLLVTLVRWFWNHPMFH